MQPRARSCCPCQWAAALPHAHRQRAKKAAPAKATLDSVSNAVHQQHGHLGDRQVCEALGPRRQHRAAVTKAVESSVEPSTERSIDLLFGHRWHSHPPHDHRHRYRLPSIAGDVLAQRLLDMHCKILARHQFDPSLEVGLSLAVQ
ncbi:hypothetical protein Thi970DRAFT_00875 [Thiorhodovibrio frisius]|uniref:Uncharacterized protein n=1 Tax=Thiorhodovibrio frisius TaxID=631362 RepID=H8YXP3_9GAMM|nr:hypothetical protein Thi970DRAFT_00875 [Thiorhodovibrio frisius]WPL23704.1 hypothetical protein Thiofri_03907 [Thiorhodovibrio frisius]